MAQFKLESAKSSRPDYAFSVSRSRGRIRRPKTVSLNGKSLSRLGSREDLEKAEVGWYFDPASTVYVKFGARGISNTVKIG